jgi:hypothetical protein
MNGEMERDREQAIIISITNLPRPSVVKAIFRWINSVNNPWSGRCPSRLDVNGTRGQRRKGPEWIAITTINGCDAPHCTASHRIALLCNIHHRHRLAPGQDRTGEGRGGFANNQQRMTGLRSAVRHRINIPPCQNRNHRHRDMTGGRMISARKQSLASPPSTNHKPGVAGERLNENRSRRSQPQGERQLNYSVGSVPTSRVSQPSSS